jgi:hypothetical protein
VTAAICQNLAPSSFKLTDSLIHVGHGRLPTAGEDRWFDRCRANCALTELVWAETT